MYENEDMVSEYMLRKYQLRGVNSERTISTEDQHTIVDYVTIIDRSITQSLCRFEGSVISRIPRNSIGSARRICRRNVENPSRELDGTRGKGE